MLGFAPRPGSRPVGARGYRAYVVGDIHGRLDLLEDVLAKIHAELQHRPAEKTLLVFVGDLIDRGPASAHVLERLRTYRREGIRPVFLLGNHEEVLLRILQGDSQLITKWRWFGGSECLQSYVDSCRFGDYLFVHAGIRPGGELDQQRQADLRWIREPFLLDETDHGFVVVHGHTIARSVQERPNRIGIDTGAYRTGVLTALVIEGSHRGSIQTAPEGCGD